MVRVLRVTESRTPLHHSERRHPFPHRRRGVRPIGRVSGHHQGSPVNCFEFLKPLFKSLDYEFPQTSISLPHALIIGRIFWVIYTLLYPWLNLSWLPKSLLLPSEVYMVGVTHYFFILKAKEELRYFPTVTPQEGMAKTISYFQERKRKTLDGPTIYAWLFVVIGMSAMFCATYLTNVGPVRPLKAFTLLIFRSMWMVRTVFLLSVAAHVGEGIYAWRLAKRVDPANAKAWFWQTFALGIFSLHFLLKIARS